MFVDREKENSQNRGPGERDKEGSSNQIDEIAQKQEDTVGEDGSQSVNRSGVGSG